MSIADEARAEAEKRWPNPNWSPVLEAKQRAYTTGYVDGASRKVEAAPSDTDTLTDEERHALIERAIKAIARNFTNETQAWNVWNNLLTTSEFVEAFQYVLSARTSQPVQVEVTDEDIRRGVKIALEEGLAGRTWPEYIRAVYDAVSTRPAALGGGE